MLQGSSRFPKKCSCESTMNNLIGCLGSAFRGLDFRPRIHVALLAVSFVAFNSQRLVVQVAFLD